MCLVAFSYRQHSHYDLIFVANRDEFYERPTRAAQFWEEHPGILAGKDLKAGGTWMGINRAGEFSALTNVRDPDMKKEDPPSRGRLVLEYLAGPDEPGCYLQKIDREADRYDGFNLLTGTPDSLFYYSNKTRSVQQLESGLYGLSNHLLNTPWPKVTRAKKELSKQLASSSIDEEALFELLKDDSLAPETELPDTGIPKELERAVSPVFIRTERYGTRCSTLLLIDKNGEVTFEERRFKPGSTKLSEASRYEFSLDRSR